MAGLAEQAERYEDMAEYMKRVAMMGADLSADERNLLSAAYKGCVSSRRQAWRSLASLEGSAEVGALIANYRAVIEAELNEKCGDVLNLLSTQLLPRATTQEGQVFFMKMQGDYYRYLAEVTPMDQRSSRSAEASKAYEEAMAIAQQALPPANALRLGLALNLAVFLNEVYGDSGKACDLAKRTLAESEPLLDASSREDQ